MAFCNSCGANLDPGAKFCAKCGAVLPDAPVAASYSPSAPPQSNNAVKIILIAVAAVLGLGVLGTVAATFITMRIAHHTRIAESNGKVKVESPFGTVETTKDPAEAAKDLGIDVYPGARALENGAASVNVGGMQTVGANFETDDPPDKVADFYRSKFPDAKVSVSDGKHYSIVSMENKHLVTITIEPEDGKTMIHIAQLSGNAVVDDNSKD
jgi:hypothetical protein